MASITIRNLDEGLKTRLRLRAARHGVSMEQEVRAILHNILVLDSDVDTAPRLAQRIQKRFQGLGAEALDIPARQIARPAPGFDQS